MRTQLDLGVKVGWLFPTDNLCSPLLKLCFDTHRSIYCIHASPCPTHQVLMFLGHDREVGKVFMGTRRTPAVLEPNTQRQAVILIVEDDPGIGAMLLTLLRQETPYDARLASDGETALCLLASQTPDLVVMDYQLPGMTGLDLADCIRTMPGVEQVPLLLISATLPQRELAQRHLPGLSKPFEIEALLTIIRQLLSA
jgi:CheY-like chemotaxis protein